MKVALIGATGKIGSKVLHELESRGHTVTGICRHPEGAAEAQARVPCDANDQAKLAGALKGYDAVISSAPFSPGLSEHIIGGVKASGVKRYIMVGGAGSLEVSPGVMLKDTLTLPDAVRAILDEASNNLKRLRNEHDLEWTFFSPAAEIGPGERTGKFRLGGDQLLKDADGKSKISYDDYAIALVDELEQGKHVRRRFTIAY